MIGADIYQRERGATRLATKPSTVQILTLKFVIGVAVKVKLLPVTTVCAVYGVTLPFVPADGDSVKVICRKLTLTV